MYTLGTHSRVGCGLEMASHLEVFALCSLCVRSVLTLCGSSQSWLLLLVTGEPLEPGGLGGREKVRVCARVCVKFV
jgi:hypothetical protein